MSNQPGVRGRFFLIAAALALVPVPSKASTHITAIDGLKIPAGSASVSNAVTFPSGSWSRVTVDFADVPVCDPWDRLFTVEVDGVEILRGTTPRTAFSVSADVSAFENLLTGSHTVTAFLANYWEQQYSDCGNSPAGQWHQVTVGFDFEEGAKPASATAFVPAWHLDTLQNPLGDPGCAGTNPSGIDSKRTITVPAGSFTHAAFYGFVTSHNCEEQWFLNPASNGPSGAPPCNPDPISCAQRRTHVIVDDVEVGGWLPFPYTYAFIGFVGGETPKSTPPGTLHQYVWWTVQQETDQGLGVHTGVGVIPPYVVDLSRVVSGLTPGTHTIELRIDGGDSWWVTSGELLLG